MKVFLALTLTIGLFLCGAVIAGLHFPVIIHRAPSLFLMIYAPMAVHLFYSEGFSGSLNVFKRLFTNQSTEGDVNCLKRLAAMGLLLGSISTVIGIIITFGRLSGGTEAIGASVAGALVSNIFGAFPCILLLPLGKKLTMDKSSMIKIAAVFSGFVSVSNLGIFTLTMWLLTSS